MLEYTKGGASISGEQTAFVVCTGVDRSSYLRETYPEDFARLLQRHDELIEAQAQKQQCGFLRNVADGYHAAFPDAAGAMEFAVAVKCEMAEFPTLPDGTTMRLRVSLHAGDIHGTPETEECCRRVLSRCARILEVCHPGQVLMSKAIRLHLREMPEGVEVPYLGSHRLRDLAEPEHLYQLVHPDFALHGFPALPTLEHRPNNLSEQPNAFIGRTHELLELKRILLGAGHRLLTIAAPGGYGKSRLATQLCAELLDEYEDGVYEVSLAPLGDAERLVTTTASAFGFRFHGRGEPKLQLLDYLREKRMLVCFDNFEHLLPGKQLLREIHGQAPQVSILATSREPLRLKGEKIYRLEPLPVTVGRPEAGGAGVSPAASKGVGTSHPTGVGTSVPTPPNLANEFASPVIRGEELPEAVQLFIDRATLVKHDLSLSAENLGLVAEICGKLDGVPLAIELAAAWADTFTLEELRKEVQEQLELTARMEDVDERHRSVRASLDWSFRLLNDDQQEVLRAISTFKGGFFVKAAKAVVRKPELRKTLAELCEKGWLFTREMNGETRFYLRDAASHEYAIGKLLESPGWQDAVMAHCRYFAGLLDREGERLRGNGQLAARKILDTELENIYEAAAVALNREDAELLLPFAKHAVSYLDMASRWQEGISLYGLLCQVADLTGNRSFQMYALLGSGKLLLRVDRYEESEKAVLVARKLAEEEQNRWGTAEAVNYLGNIAQERGQHDEAKELYEESLRIRREIGYEYGIATSLNNLALVASHLGRYDEAEELHRQSLEMKREMGDRLGVANSLYNLGGVAYAQGRFDETARVNQESLEIMREIGDRGGIGVTLMALGIVAARQGRSEEAEELYRESLRIHREIGDRKCIAISLNNLGSVAQDHGRYEEARSLFQESLEIKREIGDLRGVVSTLSNLAGMSITLEKHQDARSFLQEALGIVSDLDAPPTAVALLIPCGYLMLLLQRYAEGATLLYAGRHQSERIGWVLDPMERDYIKQGEERLEKALSPKEQAAIKLRAEKLSLEELTEYALKALEGIEL